MSLCKGKILVNIDKGYDYFKDVYAVLKETGTVQQCIIKAGLPYEQVKAENGDVLDKVIFMPIVQLHKDGAEAVIDSYQFAGTIILIRDIHNTIVSNDR